MALRAERDGGCGLIGPLTPFWGAVTLRSMGSSRLLPLAAYVVWRLLLLAAAATALTLILVRDLYSLRGTQLIALLFAAYVNLRLVFVSAKFRRVLGEGGDVDGATFIYSHIALVYQGSLVLQLFSPLGLMFTLKSELDRTDINNALYSKDLLIAAPVAALAALSLVDVVISSINFRLTYVLPTVVYGVGFMVLSILRFGKERKGFYLGLSAAALIGIALVTLLFARATNLTLYKKDQMEQRGQTIHPLDEIVVPESEAAVGPSGLPPEGREEGRDEVGEESGEGAASGEVRKARFKGGDDETF